MWTVDVAVHPGRHHRPPAAPRGTHHEHHHNSLNDKVALVTGATPGMIERASGVIVNVTTMVASFGQPGTAIYRAIPGSAVYSRSGGRDRTVTKNGTFGFRARIVCVGT